MQLTGNLRPIRNDELKLMLSWRNAPSVRANMYTRHEISIDEHLAWWEKTRQRKDQRYFMYEHSGIPLGVVGINSIDIVNQHAFWSFYAAPDAKPGTGAFIEFLLLEYAFDVLKLHKLSCEVLAFNASVIKMHQKFGFMVEGVFRSHHKLDEEFIDVYRLGILASEWRDKRSELQAKIEKMNRS